MSLTKEILQKNEKLEGLSDDQLDAIVTMSTNDENKVIGDKIGEIYGNIDRDITSVLEVQKPEKKKTYEWLKEDILPMVKESKELKEKLKTAKTEKEELEKKIQKGDGLDEELKGQLEKANKKIEELTLQAKADKELLENKIKEKETANFDLRVNFLSSEAEKGLEFSDGIPKSARSILIKSAREKILSEYEMEEIEGSDGKKKTVFKKDGVVANNPDNSLNPYTMEDLFRIELKDSLKAGNPKTGANSHNIPKDDKSQSQLNLSGINNQVDADEEIVRYLMATGLERGSEDFDEKFTEIRKENKVAELPMRQ